MMTPVTTAVSAPAGSVSPPVVTRVRPSTVVLVLIVGLAVSAAVLRMLHRGHVDSFFTNGWLAVEVTVALVYAPAGVLILRRRGSRPIAWLFLLAAGGNALSAFATEYGSHGLYYAVGRVPEPALVSSLQSWVWMPGNLLLGTLVPLLLPDGRLRAGRRWRWLAAAAIVGTLLRIPLHATNPWPWPLGPPASPLAVTSETARNALGWATGVGMVLVVVAAVGGLVSMWAHFRSDEPARRAQLRWLLAGAAAVALNVLMDPVDVIVGDVVDADILMQLLQVVALPLLPLTAAVAVLRHRLWGIDTVINRAVFWLTASASVLALYAGSVVVTGAVLGSRGATASAMAAGVVAVAFQPIRSRLQAWVDRMVYGDRGDPLAVARRLGSTLRGNDGPDSALQQVAETLGRSLNLEMAAIELDGPPPDTRVAHWGPDREPDAVFPLTYRGEHIGALLIGCQAGDEITPRFREAINDLCPQAAAVAAASRFEHELIHANRRIIMARDDERLRLRRDLHDGLGPALAGMALGISAARNHVEGGDAGRAVGLLDELAGELERKVEEIRAIVYGLRPPQLDDLGLLGAIRHHLHRYAAAPVSLEMQSVDGLPALAAATESAAYHVVVAAVDNAVRHAKAATCTVQIAFHDDHLVLVVEDDGCGVNGPEGVGIRSMRERTCGVDGTLRISRGATGGTVVTAHFPLGAA